MLQPGVRVSDALAPDQTGRSTSISKTQRDFFLREQCEAIQRELGESDPNASEIRILRETRTNAFAGRGKKGGAESWNAAANASRGCGIRGHSPLFGLILACLTKETEDKIDLPRPSAF